MQTLSPRDLAPEGWPETLEPRQSVREAFPMKLFARWLMPSVLGLLLLLAGYWYFEQRAAKYILFKGQERAIGAVRADGTQTSTWEIEGWNTTSSTVPQWSPDGSRFAAVGAKDGKTTLAVAQPKGQNPIFIEMGERSADLPERSWSGDGAFLATLNLQTNEPPHLMVVNLAQQQTVPLTFTLSASSPVMWRPQQHELVVTALSETLTPTLQIVAVDGTRRAVAGTPAQHSGQWSPAGDQLVFVAPPASAPHPLDQAGGAIWLANAAGGEARSLVAEGSNFAPTWSPDGSAVFFTRAVTETNSFDLYRIGTNGQGLARIGATIAPRDNRLFNGPAHLAWSPDGQRCMYQGPDGAGHSAVFVGAADCSGGQAAYVARQGSTLNVAWSPTNRALLIGENSEQTIYWLNNSRSITLPQSELVSWQP